MKPVVIPHASYQDSVLKQLQEHFVGGALTLLNKDWPLIAKLWITDLSGVTRFLRDDYDPKGPSPRDPASMLRSYLVFLFTNPTMGITEWVNELYRAPLYAILSGFEPKNIPGIGTFYDFFHRLWGSDRLNGKPSESQRRRKKPKKGKKKGEKARTTTPRKVERLINWMVRHADHQKPLPADRLFDLFQSEILTVSNKLGLLGDSKALGVAGDGTPIVTAAYPRSKPTCDCRAQGLGNCDHPRLLSQPDCDSGWDSARERYFNGYDLYMLSASDSPYDLPLYPRLHPASRHDAVGLVVSTVEFSQRFSLGTVGRMLLDAAHDAEAIYTWLDGQDIEPFIDLNPRSKKIYGVQGDMKISAEGIPICSANLKMKPNGYDHSQNRQKWRCPLASGTHNACENPCSTAKYGRTFHTHSEDNLRLFPKTPRESEQWKAVYKRRTSIERSNKREKIDYQLEAGRHRSTAMWYIRLYGIMMCQHMDAWFRHQEENLKTLKTRFPFPT
ncbi:MAG TPA: transposase [Bacillales bacterium]|nr:transposase [Bacillales bacterium]